MLRPAEPHPGGGAERVAVGAQVPVRAPPTRSLPGRGTGAAAHRGRTGHPANAKFLL